MVTILGNPLPDDAISREEAQELADFQAMAWRIDRDLHDRAAKFQARLDAGAKWESTEYVWDSKNRMIRSARKKAGGE